MTGSTRRSPRERQRGQALVEFALILLPLMLLLLAVLQFGLIFATQIGIQNTIRDVARYTVAAPTETDAAATAQRTRAWDELTTRLRANVPFYSAANLNGQTPPPGPPSDVTFCAYQDATGKYSVRATVEVHYRHTLVYPLLAAIVDPIDGATDGALRIAASETMRVENRPLDAAPTGMATCS